MSTTKSRRAERTKPLNVDDLHITFKLRCAGGPYGEGIVLIQGPVTINGDIQLIRLLFDFEQCINNNLDGYVRAHIDLHNSPRHRRTDVQDGEEK